MKLITSILLTGLFVLFLGCEKENPIVPDDEEQEDEQELVEEVKDPEYQGVRDPFAGVYGIWYGQNAAVLNSVYLTGGQIMVQWADCEPTEGSYDFTLLNSKLADMAQRGLKTTVQINGNSKPGYLFDHVPYLPYKVHVQVSDDKGSLMYWHPYFTESYLNFIAAYAAFIKESPYKEIITGIRQNYNMFGTEIGWFTGLYALEESEWVVPPGVTYVKASSSESESYEKKVLAQFVKEFVPEVNLFLRSSVSDEFVDENIDLIEGGKIGFFQTGAAMEQNQWFEQVTRYDKFVQFCKPGMTYGFSEIMSGRVDPYSEIQWQYWRVLSELHCGISYIGTRPTPFEKAHNDRDNRYHDLLKFADKYVGFHALPDESPGAWIAFRGEGDNFPWDYTFLMNSLDGSSLTDRKLVGSNSVPYGAWAQKLAVGGKVYLDIHDDMFLEEKNSGDVSAVLRVVYFDSSTGSWNIRYDAAEEPEKILKTVTNRNSNEWKTIKFSIEDGYFGNRAFDMADIVIENVDAPECVLHMVEIMRR
jgi:hypothetical protein